MSERPPTPRIEDFRAHFDVEVRFRDLDAFSHVNNAVFATYFEGARLGYVRALGHAPPDADVVTLQPFIMLEFQCRFLAQVGYGDPLAVHVRSASVGTKSFVLEYLITPRSDGVAVATGKTTQVCFDYSAQRTIPVPPHFRECIERFEGRPSAA